jgi:hypothetical protein
VLCARSRNTTLKGAAYTEGSTIGTTDVYEYVHAMLSLAPSCTTVDGQNWTDHPGPEHPRYSAKAVHRRPQWP